jgi:hypothetical protein
MGDWSQDIEYDFPELFSLEDRPEFPASLEEGSGIRIAADRVSYDGTALGLHVLVSHTLPLDYEGRLQSVDRALTLIIEHPATGRCEAFGLEDPHKRFPPRRGANLAPGEGGALGSAEDDLTMGFVEVPLEIRIDEAKPGSEFYLRVVLEQLVSNTLAVDAEEASVVSYLHGSTHVIEPLGADDDEGEDA